jgi:excisionase family DNA binding protein
MDSLLMRRKEVYDVLGISKPTLSKMVQAGTIRTWHPYPGSRYCWYLRASVEAVAKARKGGGNA